MARLISDFSNGETEYSDGNIEKDILKIVKNNSSYDKIIEKDKRWPVIYHLSHVRQNILNWYPLAKDKDVLEIGAGCGAITGLLCEKCKHVTAIELTKIRSEINYERNKDYENLDIYIGDFFKLEIDKKFDYITLIGVLEYAAFMSHDKNPYADMLQKIKTMLKPNGHILIAIENRFGLKYFAGAREDHTGGFFDGINGYKNNVNIKTFTKSELKELLESCGFNAYKFYYPLPDYKFPYMIYTDETIDKFDDYLNLKALDNYRFELFNEHKVMKQLSNENVLGTFSNSFFVDIGPNDFDILMARMSTERKNDFRIITLIENKNGKCIAEKKALTNLSKSHIAKMYDNYCKYKSIQGFELSKCYPVNDLSVEFEFLEGERLSSKIVNCINGNDMDGLYKILDWYYNCLISGTELKSDFYSSEFKMLFGEETYNKPLHFASVCDLDMTFDNIIFAKNGIKHLDYEWIVDFPVPLEYIFWRACFNCSFIKSNEEFFDEIISRYGISKDMTDAFKMWDYVFLTKHVGSSSLSSFALENRTVELNEIGNGSTHVCENTGIRSKIYLDYGTGFNENDSIVSDEFSNNIEYEFNVALENRNDLKKIRFDPLEGSLCKCLIHSAESDVGTLAFKPINSLIEGDYDIFTTTDPQYIFEGDLSKVTKLKLSYDLIEYENSEIEHIIISLFNSLKGNISELESGNAVLQNKYDSIISSKSWKMMERMRSLIQKFK